MNKVTAVLAAVVGAALVAATTMLAMSKTSQSMLTIEPRDTETVVSTVTETEIEPPAVVSTDDVYLDVLKAGSIYITSETAIGLAEAICGSYDTGSTHEQIIQTMEDNGLSTYDAAYIDQAAKMNYCPEHL